MRQVQATGRRIVASTADVRDYATLKGALDAGVDELGRLDIVSANAGVVSFGPAHELSDETWSAVITSMATGAVLQQIPPTTYSETYIVEFRNGGWIVTRNDV